MARRFSFSRFHIDTTGITSHALRKTQTGKIMARSQRQTADTLSPSPFVLVISSQLVDHYEGGVDPTAEDVATMGGGTDMLETTDAGRLTVQDTTAEDADWSDELEWNTDGSAAGSVKSHELKDDEFSDYVSGSEIEDCEPEYDCVELDIPSSDNGCSDDEREQSPRVSVQDVYELGFRWPKVKTRAYREHLEESSSEEDAKDEEILKPSWLASRHEELDHPGNIPLPSSPNAGDGLDVVEEEDIAVKTTPRADLASELARALDDSIASLKADTTDEPELDETTLELIAHVESLKDPKAPKTVSERHHTVRPQKSYPVHNTLTLADVETSRPFPQPQPRPDWYEWEDWHELSGSKGHLNDRTDVADAVEDLKILSANLSTDITRAHRQCDHNTPLQDEVLDEWLDQSIATTNALLRQGKTALASKASEMVGRVLANEKGVGRGKTAGCDGGQMRGVEEESPDITSERRASSRGRFPLKVGSGGWDSWAL